MTANRSSFVLGLPRPYNSLANSKALKNGLTVPASFFAIGRTSYHCLAEPLSAIEFAIYRDAPMLREAAGQVRSIFPLGR
jgi:hypothetical protein